MNRWQTIAPIAINYEWWMYRPDPTARPYAIMAYDNRWYFGNAMYIPTTHGQWLRIILPSDDMEGGNDDTTF